MNLSSASTTGYFKRGRELSGVLGVTLSGEKKDTDYRSGTDLSLELAYRQHLPNGLAVGLAGYYLQQLTAHSRSTLLDHFKGRVAAIGPEIGYRFDAAGRTMGIDFRWYYEFATRNWVKGQALFLTFSLPLQRDPPGAGKLQAREESGT